jgi:hypothetical protein
VSYGSAMGARGVQQLRETTIELQLAPIRSSVHNLRHVCPGRHLASSICQLTPLATPTVVFARDRERSVVRSAGVPRLHGN